jgi:16S rRNA (guanine527-N7)-methyltransferase
MPDHAQTVPVEPMLSNVPRETLARLSLLVTLVEKWTPAINLIAPGEHGQIWSRHVADSLRLVPMIPVGTTSAIDLGSGAGFPGLVLAIATNIPFDLVESDRRKAVFLEEAARITNAPVAVHCSRIEAAVLPLAPLLTARALAPLDRLLGYAARFLRPDGLALFPKGARAEMELIEARRRWTMQVRRHDDPGRPGSTILAISGIARA